jgi:hypothetical protein
MAYTTDQVNEHAKEVGNVSENLHNELRRFKTDKESFSVVHSYEGEVEKNESFESKV